VDEDSLFEALLEENREKMGRVVEHTQAEFASIRTGRAAPALVEKLRVDYYGAEVPLQQIAGIQAPEARVLLITPYDRSSLKAIEKAIQQSDLGVNPNNDGSVIRLTFPVLTAERREQLVRSAHAKAEDGRVALRNLRRAARKQAEELEKDGDVTTDELERAEKELERLTHEHVASVDRMLSVKEQELRTV
jgi:ribosome recycling factor